MNDEGIVKFHCDWHYAAAPESPLAHELLATRNRLFDLGLVGALADGTGYGNASARLDQESFTITGTGSGGIRRASVEILTVVTSVDFANNSVCCYGPMMASSESMTHAAIYRADARITAVLHLHSRRLWESLIDRVPTTRGDVPYGTPAMADEVARLFADERSGSSGIVVMGGHADGILCFGGTIESAESVVLAAMQGGSL